jgi:phosphoenolpyruvate carboxykinase (ATP)
MWHPMKYAAMLADKMEEHGSSAWFVNTGWTGGGYGKGHRMSLKHTRAIVDAIHSGELDRADYTRTPIFGLEIPSHISGVPDEVLNPRETWEDKKAYDSTLAHLAELFIENMAQFTSPGHSEQLLTRILHGGPQLSSAGPREQEPRRSSSCGLGSCVGLDKLTQNGRLIK